MYQQAKECQRQPVNYEQPGESQEEAAPYSQQVEPPTNVSIPDFWRPELRQ